MKLRVTGIIASMLIASLSQAATNDLTGDKPFWARSIGLPPQNREKVFLAKDHKANFTFSSGVDNLTEAGGLLKFTLTTNKAILGWGNFLGKQPVADIADLWDHKDMPVLKVNLPNANSAWSMRFWGDGKRVAVPPVKVAPTNSGWMELAFPSPLLGPVPDGLEFEVQGKAGETFELEWVKIIQPMCEGYCRKTLVLPEGKIWRAVADVGGPEDVMWCGDTIKSILYINGQQVPRSSSGHLYHTTPVDIAPYLQPGKNVIGFYGYRVGGYNPLLYFQAKVTLASGETIAWQSDMSWKYSPKEEPGWNTAGYDDSTWTNVNASNSGLVTDYGLMPGDKGRLIVRDPKRKDLFYTEKTDVALEILVPEGLKAQTPVLEYILTKADADGNSTPVKEGTQPAFAAKDSSLVYAVNLGVCPRGVYAVGFRLKGSDGAILDERPAQPLMVMKTLSPRIIEGKDWFEGLETELEDTIDFTNPKDPHPWIETMVETNGTRTLISSTEGKAIPSLVKRNGLEYREVIGRRNSFSYRLQFKQPGSFYLLELEYPDDAERLTEVSISSKQLNLWNQSESGVGVETGGKLFLTGKMQKHRWIHVADPQIHSVDVCALERPAAAKSLKIYRIKGDLPALGDATNRLFGIHTENCKSYGGFARNLGVQRPPAPPPDPAEAKLPGNVRIAKELERNRKNQLRDLVWWLDTTERYVQYLKFTGQNMHIMGVFQYCESAVMPPAHLLTLYDTARQCLAHALDANGITILAGIEWSQFNNLITRANNAQVAKGADTFWMVNGRGQQFYGIAAETTVPNWLHPKNRVAFQNLMRDVTAQYGDLPSFKGIHLLMGPIQGDGYWIPSFGTDYANPLAYTYDDVTFAQFEKELGQPLPIPKTDPQRFEKRAALMKNNAIRDQFRTWRTRQLQQFLADGVKALQEKRSDLQFVTVLGIETEGFFKSWLASGKSYPEYLKDYGIDISLLDAVPDLWTGRWTLSWRQGDAPQNPYLWIPRVDARVTGAYAQDAKRYVIVRSSWDEEGVQNVKGDYQKPTLIQSDWIADNYITRLLPQPAHAHCREAFVQALISGDPEIMGYGFIDLNLNVGSEQEVREFIKAFTRLPRAKFAPVLDTGFETNFAIRKLSKDGKTWFYVVNPGYWQISGTVTLKTDGEILDLATGKSAPTEKKDGKLILPLTLAPYGLAAFQVNAAVLDIESYDTKKISPEEQAFLENIIARVDKLTSDPEIKLILDPPNREFIAGALVQARQALAANNYARCWALLSNYRFWSLWKNFLEKAAQGLAFLPASVEKETAITTNNAGLRILAAALISAPLQLDGKLDDPAWQKVKYQVGFVDRDRYPGMAEVGVKALYDQQALYLGFICADKDVRALKAGTKWSWTDDDIVMFIQPDESSPVYYQLGVNPKGLQFHQKVVGGERDYTPLPGWKPVVAVADKYWTAEVVLPYQTFGLSAPPTVWRVNFHRILRDNRVENASWTFSGGDWHNISRCGRLEFRKSEGG